MGSQKSAQKKKSNISEPRYAYKCNAYRKNM